VDASPSPATVLETDRLLLRCLLECDVPSLVDLWTDPVVTRCLGGARERGRLEADLRESLGVPPAGPHDLWSTVERATGALVGHCGLLRKEVGSRDETEVV